MPDKLIIPKRKVVYLGRHGESEANVQGIRQGKDGKLTVKGLAQARAAARYLRELGIQANLSSTDERAYLSALEIERETGLPPELDDLYIERRPPPIAIGVSSKDLEMNRRVSADNIIGEITGKSHLGGEHSRAMRARAKAIREKLLAHPADCFSVMSHYRTISSVVCDVQRMGRVVDDDYHYAEETALYANGGISCLIYDRVRKPGPHKPEWIWKVGFLNDISHLRGIE